MRHVENEYIIHRTLCSAPSPPAGGNSSTSGWVSLTHQSCQRLWRSVRLGGGFEILRFRKESVLSNDKVEEAEEEELGPMFPQRSKLLAMNPLKQVKLYFDIIHRPNDSSISSSHQRRRLMDKRCWTRMMMMRLRLWTMRVLGMRWRMTMRWECEEN